MKQYVIIGNGIAAAGCIIRSCDKESKSVVISKETHPVYCRPLISYYLEGKTDLDKIGYRSESFYTQNGCEVIYGETDAAIDYENKTVILSRGNKVPFSALCVATGSSPFVPPFEGLDTVKNRFSFMTLDDTLALEKAITPESKVLIIGAGLIGLKCAEGLHGRVKSITVCDLADKVLSSILDDDTAPMVQNHPESSGIEFMMADSATKFEANRAAGSYVTEKDGGTVYMQMDEASCKKFFVRDGLLKGYILVDKVERGGVYTALIREQTPLDTVDFDLLKENASSMAFSSENRRNKFGGVL